MLFINLVIFISFDHYRAAASPADVVKRVVINFEDEVYVKYIYCIKLTKAKRKKNVRIVAIY